MISVHVKQLKRRIALSSDEERAIRALAGDVRQVAADEIVVRSGDELNSSVLLLDGWLARSKDLASGERQVTQLHVAGDFADLHGFVLGHVDHDVLALTDCRVKMVPHERLRDLMRDFPRLLHAYWFMTNVDAAITRELALSLGQRSAIARMAHLFCELHARLQLVDRARADGYDFPLTQRELAECLGLTVVHANRTLQELRRRGLVELGNRRLTIRDRRGLAGLAEFDPAYLYIDSSPR
jgi:CRP-like cAMP-binding protein